MPIAVVQQVQFYCCKQRHSDSLGDAAPGSNYACKPRLTPTMHLQSSQAADVAFLLHSLQHAVDELLLTCCGICI
jgi:hypothetical protein